MAGDDQGRSPRRGPAAYQPIEPLDEGTAESLDTAAPSVAAPPREQAQSSGQAAPADTAEETRRTDRAAPVVPIAARFASAAAALAFAGQMLSIGRADGLVFGTDSEHARWVGTQAELDIARELAAAAHGVLFVAVAPGRLAEDHGWGAPPAADAATVVDATTLSEVRLADVVRIAGLRPVRERPVATAHVLLPGSLLGTVARRALDLRLDVTHRPVRLRPLFTEQGQPDTGGETVMIEMRLSAGTGDVPMSILAALAREPRLTVCRPAGDDGSLLVQYGLATPLPDDLLAGLIQDGAWVLSGGHLGCHVLEPAGTFVDSVSCVRLDDGYSLRSATPPPDDQPALPRLRIVRMRTYGRGVDAFLLSDADLDAVALMLEGHPLSESAQLIRGRDRHLLVAAGGFLQDLPIGDALYRLGPGPLYLPLGHGTRPQLPASARRTLFTADEKTAVVLLPSLMLTFATDLREPVWRLWAGPPPEVDLQLPEDSISALRAGNEQSEAEDQSAADDRGQPGAVTRTWRDAALEAEFRGELGLAAELHERHGDPVRAAHLYALAAEEAG
jgi:hypothetical protein